jgi:hypothetical protein
MIVPAELRLQSTSIAMHSPASGFASSVLKGSLAVRKLLLAALLAIVTAAHARDDGRFAQADPAWRDWFRSLNAPSNKHISCCDESDCLRTEVEMTPRGYRARTPDGQWIDVPELAILYDRGNPTGAPVLCTAGNARDGWRVLCFVPGEGT